MSSTPGHCADGLFVFRLDFAKLTNSSQEEIVVAHNRSLGIANLESLFEAVAKTTWARKRRVDLVSAEEQCRDENLGQRSEFVEEKVDLILDVQERIEGWEAWIDVGGMKRVLLNLLSNALKVSRLRRPLKVFRINPWQIVHFVWPRKTVTLGSHRSALG